MRKFIQISATRDSDVVDALYALADDGTVWRLDAADSADRRTGTWQQLRECPQPKATEHGRTPVLETTP